MRVRGRSTRKALGTTLTVLLVALFVVMAAAAAIVAVASFTAPCFCFLARELGASEHAAELINVGIVAFTILAFIGYVAYSTLSDSTPDRGS